MESGLTVRWQVDFAVAGEEGVALALRLELGRELFGRYLSARNVADLLLRLIMDIGFH